MNQNIIEFAKSKFVAMVIGDRVAENTEVVYGFLAEIRVGLGLKCGSGSGMWRRSILGLDPHRVHHRSTQYLGVDPDFGTRSRLYLIVIVDCAGYKKSL